MGHIQHLDKAATELQPTHNVWTPAFPLTSLQQTFSKPIPFDPSCSEREKRGTAIGTRENEMPPQLPSSEQRASQPGELEESRVNTS